MVKISSTFFCSIDQKLNAWPLTPVKSDPSIFLALTSDHFLVSRRRSNVHSTETSLNNFTHRKHLGPAKAYAGHLCSMQAHAWCHMVTMVEKIHPFTDSSNQMDMWYQLNLIFWRLVWMIAPHSPRGYFFTVKIGSLNYGPDGIARFAKLISKGKCYIWLILELIPLASRYLPGEG